MNFRIKRLDTDEILECETIQEEWIIAQKMSLEQQKAQIPVNVSASIILGKKKK